MAAAVLELLESNPRRHRQSIWVCPADSMQVVSLADVMDEPECGTTMCVAGGAVLLSGATLDVGPTEILRVGDDGERKPINMRRAAKDLLGLTPLQAEYLFFHTSESTALEFLRRLAATDDPSTVKVPGIFTDLHGEDEFADLYSGDA